MLTQVGFEFELPAGFVVVTGHELNLQRQIIFSQ
jgi:hypothetical protein